MRLFALSFLCSVLLAACHNERVFEQNEDLVDQTWLVKTKPAFDFVIQDTSIAYNLYCNIRNEVSYPKANLYFTYYLKDSSGMTLEKKLMTEFLFDKKTGKPFGKSGLGDIYDHQIAILKNYKFKAPSKYAVTFEQFMRADSLQGILAVGLRVEKVPTE
jgi:gliding motility-associated lipoprotein GldH